MLSEVSEKDSEDTEYQPKCHLSVTKFSKEGQSSNLANNQVSIDLALQLAQMGDNACNTSSAVVVISKNDQANFTYILSPDDVEFAVSDIYKFTVIIDTDSRDAFDAAVTFSDDNAVDNAESTIPNVYVHAASTSCKIEVRKFCLNDVSPSNEAGMVNFEFDLKVIASPFCQGLTASLDIINA